MARSDRTPTDGATNHHVATHSPGAVEADRSDATSSSSGSTGSSGSVEYRGTGIMWSGIIVLLGVAALTIAAFQNTQSVAVEFLWIDGSAPLVVIVLVAIGVTVLVDEAVGFVWRRRRRRRLREQHELSELRSRS